MNNRPEDLKDESKIEDLSSAEYIKQAIDLNRIDIIKRYLSVIHVNNINELFFYGDCGDNFLTYAVAKRKNAIVELLLTCDAIDMNRPNLHGLTASMIAIQQDNSNIFSSLLNKFLRSDRNADLFFSDNMLSYMLDAKPYGLIAYLLNANKMPQDTLYRFITLILTEIEDIINVKSFHAKNLEKIKNDISKSKILNIAMNARKLLLKSLRMKNQRFAVFLLRYYKIDLSAMPTGKSLITRAYEAAMNQVVGLLIDRKAELDSQTYHDKTILMHAAEKKNVELIDLLKVNYPSLNINQQDSFEQSAICYAVYSQHLGAIESVLKFEHIDLSSPVLGQIIASLPPNNINSERIINMLEQYVANPSRSNEISSTPSNNHSTALTKTVLSSSSTLFPQVPLTFDIIVSSNPKKTNSGGIQGEITEQAWNLARQDDIEAQNSESSSSKRRK